MKKRIIITACLSLLGLTACNLSYGGDGGEIVAKLTQLPTPTIREVIDDYVYWDEVPNASSYTIKINGVPENAGNSLKYSIGAILDSRIEYNVPTVAHITVTAKGNQILYSDSEPSQEYTYTYTKKSNQIDPPSPTKISVPRNIAINKAIISWADVDNAIGYRLKINDNIYTTSRTQFSLATIFNEKTWFTFTMQAVASEGYLDSDWTLLTNEYYVGPDEQQEIPDPKTYLTVPSNIQFFDGIITWNAVANCIGYEVKINNDVYTTSATKYDVSQLFAEETSFVFSVRSVASSNSNYLSSDWSLPTTETYRPAQQQVLTDFADADERKVLGRNINVITAKGISSDEFVSGADYIFDQNELFKKQIGKDTILLQEEQAISSSSYDEFVEKEQLDLSVKVGVGNLTEDHGDGPCYFPGSLDFGVSVGGGYKRVSKSETSEFYYKFHHNLTGNRVEIKGYKTDMDFYRSIVTDKFKNAVAQVTNETTAKNFVSNWGTHVVMSAYYGAAFEASYYMIKHAEQEDLSWYESAETNLTAHLLFKDVTVNVSEAYANTKESTKETRMAGFTAKALGGASSSFVVNDISDFRDNCSTWAKSVNESNWVMVDVPDNSLYCIWDFLDDTYSAQKQILDNYLVQETNGSLGALKNKINRIYDEDYIDDSYGENIYYQSSTKTLTIDLSPFQKSGSISGFKYDGKNYSNGVVTLTKLISDKEIEHFVIKGKYGTEDSNGYPVTNKINGLSFKLADYWNSKEADITLENLGLYSSTNSSFIQSAGDIKLTIKNSVEIESQYSGAPLIRANNISINGETGSSLQLIGAKANTTNTNGQNCLHAATNMSISRVALTAIAGNGCNGSNGVSYSSTATGNSTPATGGNGSNGGAGGNGIYCKQLHLTQYASLDITGGNGGNGGNGGTGEKSNCNDVGKGGRGGAGGAGGNGGAAVNVETFSGDGTISNLKFTGGNGGTGGTGGRGGDGVDTNRRDSGGNGGNGGVGGDSGLPLSVNSYTLNKNVKITLGNGGNGGTGGKGGTAWRDSVAGNRVYTGNGGNGGNGGNCLKTIHNVLASYVTYLNQGTVGQGGTKGKAGDIGSGGVGAINSGTDGSNGSAGSYI